MNMAIKVGDILHLQGMSSIKLYEGEKWIGNSYVSCGEVYKITVTEIIGNCVIDSHGQLHKICQESGDDFNAIIIEDF